MKNLILLISFILFFTTSNAQECVSFDNLIKQGDAFFNAKPPDYRKAIDAYTAAWLDCPAQAKTARTKISAVYDKIEKLKDQALMAEKNAKAEKENALKSEKIANDEKEKAKKAEKVANDEKEKAQAEYERAQKLADGALELLKRSLPAGETDVFAYYLRQADTAFAKGNYDEAIGLYQGAKLLPEGIKKENSIQDKISKAQLCIDLLEKAGKQVFELKLGEAIDIYNRLLQTNPNDPTATYRIEAFKLPETKTMLADLKLITVKGGSFKMGSENGNSDEKPHNVILTDFQVGKYEVTNAQYARFLNEYKSDTIKNGEFKGQPMIDLNGKYENEKCRIRYNGASYIVEEGYAQNPVIYVTWYGANEFCRYYGLNLPTEAQWEFAARGGIKSKSFLYAGSDTINLVAEYYGNNNKGTKPVGGKMPNELGLYDMSGNVWEWCNDWYESGYYSSSPEKNPKGPVISSIRVGRGGSWYSDANYCRVSDRYGWGPSFGDDYLGFRVVLVP